MTKQQFFCTHVFLRRRCTTTTSKCLISRFVEDGNTRQQLSFSFPQLWYSPVEFNSKKIVELNKNKGDKVRGSANSLFKWRFRSRRSRWCLSSLSYDACSVRDDIVFTLYVRMRMFENGDKKSPSILLFSVNSALKSLLSALMLLYSYEKMKQISSESTKHDLFCWFLQALHQNLKKLAQLSQVSIHVHPSNLCTDAPSPQKKIITAYVLYKSPESC